MSAIKVQQLSRQDQYDLRAEASLKLYEALRQAVKVRFSNPSEAVGPLHAAIGKDKGQLSRLINGKSKTIEFETLAVILEALNFDVQIEVAAFESLAKPNFCARPQIAGTPGPSSDQEDKVEVNPSRGAELGASRGARVRGALPRYQRIALQTSLEAV